MAYDYLIGPIVSSKLVHSSSYVLIFTKTCTSFVVEITFLCTNLCDYLQLFVRSFEPVTLPDVTLRGTNDVEDEKSQGGPALCIPDFNISENFRMSEKTLYLIYENKRRSFNFKKPKS